MQNITLNIKDEILTSKGSGIITKLNDVSVWLDNKAYRRETILKELKSIIHYESPNKDLDWSNEKEVDEYYLSFNQWAGVLRMGDTRTSVILEVKNNKVLFEGEYYLPYYSHYINKPDKPNYENGYVFGYCIKMFNAYYSHQTEHRVNVFYVDKVIPTSEYEVNIKKAEDKKNLNDIDYLKNLDLNHINSTDLDLLRTNLHLLFDKDVLPHTSNNVKFGISNSNFAFDKNKIFVSYKNRSGCIEIDNGYHGRTAFRNDYYAIIRIKPDFTNEVQYSYVDVRGKNITFDKAMLDALATQVVTVWDKAIENNAKSWG